MKKIFSCDMQFGLFVLICILSSSSTAYGEQLVQRQAKILEKTIIQAAWGSAKGEIGEAPESLDKTPGESINPIAVDSKGNVYVGDSVNYRILKFDHNGNYLSEINIKKFDEWPYKIIPDIYIDRHDNIYVVLLRKQQIVKFSEEGKQISLFDISKAGVLEKDAKGKVKLNAKVFFGIERVVVDNRGHVYILGGEQNILKMNSTGEIIQRWGPYASNASHFMFIDDLNNLYIWMPPEQKGSMFKRYDMSGKFLGSGLDIYDQIIEPFYLDLSGNVYGFTVFTDNALAVYNHKSRKLLKLPLTQEKLAFERWTVDSNGNIYHTRESGKFEIIKISLLP